MPGDISDPRANVDEGTSLKGVPVKVLVGATKEAVYVHSSVLTAHSEFFKTALKKEWREGQQHTIELLEDGPRVFHIYIQWLYTGIIYSQTNEKFGSLSYDTLAKLYILGEKILDRDFQNTVIDAIVCGAREKKYEPNKPGTHTSHYPLISAVDSIYKGTPRDSPARRLMIDMYVCYGREQWFDDIPSNVSPDLMSDLLKALMRERTVPDNFYTKVAGIGQGAPTSYYHKDHEDSESET